MKQQIYAMLELQHAMNQKVHEDWQAQNFPWYRAIWVECAELLDHQGWKWWKKQSPDHAQVALELVDIWHFGLSMEMQAGGDLESLSDSILAALQQPIAAEEFRRGVELFVVDVLTQHQFPTARFAGLMASANLSFERLYSMYIGKNMLNFFRQDNGYQLGTYQKNWQGREDNEHLAEIVDSLDTGSANYKLDVYQALVQRYQQVLG